MKHVKKFYSSQARMALWPFRTFGLRETSFIRNHRNRWSVLASIMWVGQSASAALVIAALQSTSQMHRAVDGWARVRQHSPP